MATTSAAVAAVEPVFTEPERFALAGFLAGYTRPDTRGVRARPATVCQLVPAASHPPVRARRAYIECFARDLEARARAWATITRRLCTVAGSTGMPLRRTSSITPLPLMSADRAWTMSRTPPRWTATSWAHYWSPQDWAILPTMR